MDILNKIDISKKFFLLVIPMDYNQNLKFKYDDERPTYEKIYKGLLYEC